ncbi:RNA polymerase sigma factor [Nocardioides montaniterrae]
MSAQEEVERVFRAEHGRLIATLVRRFRDIDLAEDLASEALVVALERWPADGVPPNPGAWLTTTAARRGIDRIRREAKRDAKHQAALMIIDTDEHQPTGPVEDDRLRLIFTCCHPALAPEARIALTLRLLGGLTVPEIASAFLVQDTTMGQRISRAKAKIRAANIPYVVPQPDDLTTRIDTVLTVLWLIFNEGYLASSEGEPIRRELTAEAIRLARLVRELLPAHPETTGLLALMLLTEARARARVRHGVLVPLDEQDRGGWDRALIDEGHALVRECLATDRPGRFQVQAAINAVHTDAPTSAATDWSQVVALYAQLARFDPGPVVTLNRAVAIAELDGPEVALSLVDGLADSLAAYHPFHATRAELLRRLGRSTQARAAYDEALALTDNTAERAYVARRRGELVDERS